MMSFRLSALSGADFSDSMELYISRQALGLALAGLLGLLAGLSYDVLRPFRRRAGRLSAALLDCLFSFGTASAAFFYAMGAESGRLGVWELAMTLLGFMLYMHLFSDAVYAFTERVLSTLLTLRRIGKNKIIFFAEMTKKYFHNVRK